MKKKNEDRVFFVVCLCLILATIYLFAEMMSGAHFLIPRIEKLEYRVHDEQHSHNGLDLINRLEEFSNQCFMTCGE